MWSEIEDVIEVAASVLVIVAALWAVTTKFWRTTKVVNRVVESDLIERLEAFLARDEQGSRKRVEELNIKRAG